MTVNLAQGTDALTLANVANSGTVSNVETLTGGTGNDTVTMATAMSSGTINLGTGTDAITLADGGNTVTISNSETITGGTGADQVTVATALTNTMTINLGAGEDTIIWPTRQHGDALQCRNRHRQWRGRCHHLATGITAGVINLGTGTDAITFANAVNSATVSNVETITGNADADTITIGAALTSATINLAGATDSLTLGNFANTATISNTETLLGGTGADTITLHHAHRHEPRPGAGADALTLANVANTGTFPTSRP